jgi:tRNA G46 methylase TrmB
MVASLKNGDGDVGRGEAEEADEGDDNDPVAGSATGEDNPVDDQVKESEKKYNPNKPKWWKNRSRAPTKGQKKAMNEVLKDHRLPRIPYGTVLDWNDIYPDHNQIWLEIGFGRGENLLALAHQKPVDVLLVGAEIAGTGIGVMCGRMLEGLKTNTFWSDYELYDAKNDPFAKQSAKLQSAASTDEFPTSTDGSSRLLSPSSSDDPTKTPYENVRIFPGDGAKLLPYIPSGTLDSLLITFPDPFPKDKEEEWRLIQLNTLQEMHRVLKPSTGCLYLATDHDGFYQWCHSLFEEFNTSTRKEYFAVVDPTPSRLEWVPAVSRYEKKGWEEGRSTKLSCWRALS